MELLRNEKLNINTNDIKLESDLNVLIEWKSSLDEQARVIKNDILKAKMVYGTDEQKDSNWFGRINAYKGVLNTLRAKITDRIRIIKADVKKDNIKQRMGFDSFLIKELKSYLGDEVFFKIEEESRAKFLSNN
jgi:hypothetical protein